jgi:hypothetical protein
VNSLSPLIAWLLVLIILGIAAYFARQQFRTLRGLKLQEGLAGEDRSYLRSQAWRRLVGCLLLVAIAGLLSGWYLTGQDAGIDALGDQLQAQKAAGEPVPRPEQEQAKRFYLYYLIVVLLLLLALVLVAAIDFIAIRRYSRRHFRKLYDDRRAMLERQLAELRRERGLERDGHPPA